MASSTVVLDALASKRIQGRLLQWVRSFLSNRQACVHFQGHGSVPHPHHQDGPQGSIWSPFLFNILMVGLFSVSYDRIVHLLWYTDHLALVIPRYHCYDTVSTSLALLQRRCAELGLSTKPDKIKYMVFGLPSLPRHLLLDATAIEPVNTHLYLGVVDRYLSFRPNVKYLRERDTARIRILRVTSYKGKGQCYKVKRTFDSCCYLIASELLRSVPGRTSPILCLLP